MPKGTRVSRCVNRVKKSNDEGAAIAICQSSTKQGYATGKNLKESLFRRIGRLIADAKQPLAHGIDIFDKKMRGVGAGETKRADAAIKASTRAVHRRKKRLAAVKRQDEDVKGGDSDAIKWLKARMKKAEAKKTVDDAARSIRPKKKNESKLAYIDFAYRVDEILDSLGLSPKKKAEEADAVASFTQKHSPVAKVGRGIKGVVKGTAKLGGKAIDALGNVMGGGDKEKKTIVVSHTESPKKGEDISEVYTALAGAAVRAGGSTAIRQGAVAGGRGAATGSARRGAAAGARKFAKNPENIEKLAKATEGGVEVWQAKKAAKKAAENGEEMENQNTQHNNAYVNTLVETGPKGKIEAAYGDSPHGRGQYKKLSSRPNDPSPVEAAKARKPKASIKSHTEYRRIGNIIGEMCATCKGEGMAAAKAEKDPRKKGTAYNAARREAENKRHGKKGETPRQTFQRRHGGEGVPKETRDVAKADTKLDIRKRAGDR